MRKIQYVFWKMLLRKYRYKYGYEISDAVKIGRGFYINHLGGITINPKAIIGDNVNITKGVTIGQINTGKKKGVPAIGDKVWIGANSTVVGNVKIGDNVLIAPNTYVNFDVPNDSIVIGSPAKIIEKKDATDRYVINVV
ncbi:TPA: serine acetyltransferase [Bacillus pacificus]|uniref:serine O-acetyltransferase n=1 Tax=Bacillus cereus group TaxID=86661 RepID=UPI001A973E1C|nr:MULTISPECIES: DapH/DapD/GlmU-related protein [Bacillus cereus group]MCX3302869.1 DapH/DapD/GlmU-related protein [Bacillus pacificus]MCX3329405.1 DapH/DapD/GlmU-related protein [Bacillus pacificus]MDA2035491.1 DapH/DapD/GlmU-related protein [Bacillus cereus group sp. Bcc02]HDR3487807.1 serine acetyltransferase [Bacillus pacificus]HDR7931595.1 serine acetyltransferase [Bacillus pacificus]